MCFHSLCLLHICAALCCKYVILTVYHNTVDVVGDLILEYITLNRRSALAWSCLYMIFRRWVQVACPRLSIDWGLAFDKPILTPYEVGCRCLSGCRCFSSAGMRSLFTVRQSEVTCASKCMTIDNLFLYLSISFALFKCVVLCVVTRD